MCSSFHVSKQLWKLYLTLTRFSNNAWNKQNEIDFTARYNTSSNNDSKAFFQYLEKIAITKLFFFTFATRDIHLYTFVCFQFQFIEHHKYFTKTRFGSVFLSDRFYWTINRNIIEQKVVKSHAIYNIFCWDRPTDWTIAVYRLRTQCKSNRYLSKILRQNRNANCDDKQKN